MAQSNARGRRSRPLLYWLPDVTVMLAAFLSFGRAAFAQDAALDTAKIAAGEAIYNTNCAVCHGDQLVNTGQTFDLRRLRPDERPRFEYSVRNGKNQMPPWKGVLSDEDIDRLWFYIRANAHQNDGLEYSHPAPCGGADDHLNLLSAASATFSAVRPNCLQRSL